MISILRSMTKPSWLQKGAQVPRPIASRYHQDHHAAREEQTFRLADGRNIGFAEYGQSGGVPVFYLHGNPGSRYDGQQFTDILRKLDLRLICPDRPGHGISTNKENRKLLDYPDDISQLAKHLQLQKYHIVGHSGGGPYAIACAYALPGDGLLSTSVIAGMGHPDVLTVKDDGWRTVIMLFLVKWTPGVISAIANWTMADDKRIEKTFRKLGDIRQSDQDKKFLSSPETLPAIITSMKAAYAQGAAGVIRDSQIYGEPWGFELKDVQREIKLFWGLKDDMAPPVHGRHFKQNLANAELIEFEDMTHLSTQYDEEIFRGILGVVRPKSPGGLVPQQGLLSPFEKDIDRN